MAADGADGDDEFVAFFEETDFAFAGEGGVEADFPMVAGAGEGIGAFGARDGGGVVVFAVEEGGEGADAVESEDFALLEGDAADGDGGEVLFDFGEEVLLGGAPFAEPAVLDFGGEDAVDDDAVNGEAVEGEVDEGALGFADDHFLGVGDEADAGDLGVFHEVVDALDFFVEVFDVGEVGVGGEVDGGDAVGEGADGFKDAALEGEDVLHVPVEGGGHGDEAEGFGGGGAVEDDDVVAAVFAPLVDVHHGGEFFHAGEDGHFLGFDVVEAGGFEDAGDVAGDLLPVAFDFLLDVDFVDVEVGGDFAGVGGGGVEEAGFEVEGVGEGVGGVDAHDEGAVAELGEADAGSGGEAGFADTAFAAEEEDTHQF